MKARHYDTFICSSHRDFELSNILVHFLENAGISTFFSMRDLLAGTEFQETIVNSINSSQFIIFLCTPNSIQSNWVKNEVAYAIKLRKTIVSIIVDDTELPDDLKLFLSLHNRLSAHSDTFTSDIKGLTTTLIKWLNQRESSKPAEEIVSPSTTPRQTGSENIEPLPTSKSAEETVSPSTTPRQTGSENTEPLPTSKQADKTVITIKKFLSILFYVFFGAVTLIYLFGIIYSADSGDYPQTVGLLSPIVIAVIILAVLIVKRRKYELKLYCEAEGKTDANLTITLDDKLISEIKGKGFVKLNERKGNYLISIDSDNSEIISKKFTYNFKRENHGEIKHIILKKNSSSAPSQSENSTPDFTMVRCFIAGSTRLINERNATRAVLSILYNKWESHKLVISSYTFEDFSNSYTIGGQQIQYNEFIKDKAACAIFIVTENVGDKTLEEYRLAIDTFKENRQRPKIFVYAHNLSDSETTRQFIEEVRKNNSYWREYDGIKQLMSLVKEDIDSELFNIFIFNKM